MSKYQAPPGTHDIYPNAKSWADNTGQWHRIESLFREVCRLYGYQEIRTPIFEATDLFTRAVGEGTDIVGKEMYTFTDRGDRSMTLRPEGTAPALRAYIENGIYADGGTTKLYYIGPIFRYERQQKGRYRQHTQCGIEALGSQDPMLDAEVIALAMTIYRRLGLDRLNLKINSVGCSECRPSYREALLDFTRPLLSEMSAENQRRFHENPLRMLDTKDENDIALLKNAPLLIDFLCPDCAAHFESLKINLTALEIAYDIDTHLVRGFDYYTKTAFEVQSPDIGAQSTLCGGGRYDGLVEQLGGPATPGIGFGLGVERALLALQALDRPGTASDQPSAFVVTLGDAARSARLGILADLRVGGIPADTDYSGKSMKAQMRAANKFLATHAVILGDDEVAKGTVQVKTLATGEQMEMAQSEMAAYLRGAAQ